MPASLAANVTFRTSILIILFHHISQLKDSPKIRFCSLNPVQNNNNLFVCIMSFDPLYNTYASYNSDVWNASSYVTVLSQFIMVLASDSEDASYFCQLIHKNVLVVLQFTK